MIIFGANWCEILAWNLRTAGSLWAAWGGGLSSAVYGTVRLQANVRCEGLRPGTEIGVEVETDDVQPQRQRHLTLVD